MFKLKLPKLGINFKKLQIGKLSKPGRVLVLESTGYSLHGAVASRTTSSAFSLGAVVLSTATDRTAAVGEVLAQLKSQSKKRLPATAILLSSSAASALLSLPVDPKKPRPAPQMAEMVRWELEELSVQQNELWTLGALLMGRGDLSHAQRRELEGGARAGNQRLNAAVYQGAVDAVCLEECLLLQEQLLGDDETLAAGWFGQAAQEDQSDEGFSWLVSGVGSSQCVSWVKALKKHGIFLASLYPRLGACLPLIEIAPEWLLVDVAAEQWSVFRGQGRHYDTLLAKSCTFGRVDATAVVETVGDLLRLECSRLYLSAPDDQWLALADALEQAFGRRSLQIVAPGETGPQSAAGSQLAALAGAARHHLGMGAKALPLVAIIAQPPPPPLWKRKHLYPWMAIGLVVVGLIGVETYLRVEGAKYKSELDRLDLEYERKLQIKKQADEMAAEVRKMQAVLDVKKQELQTVERQRDILDNIIRRRQELIPGLLQALSESTGELVMIDLLEENSERNGLTLAGWSLTDTEGQQFANTLNEQLTPWKYRVKDVKLFRGKGRLGIDGYQLNIWLAQAPIAQERKPQIAPQPTAPPAAEKKTPAKPVKKTKSKGGQAHG